MLHSGVSANLAARATSAPRGHAGGRSRPRSVRQSSRCSQYSEITPAPCLPPRSRAAASLEPLQSSPAPCSTSRSSRPSWPPTTAARRPHWETRSPSRVRRPCAVRNVVRAGPSVGWIVRAGRWWARRRGATSSARRSACRLVEAACDAVAMGAAKGARTATATAAASAGATASGCQQRVGRARRWRHPSSCHPQCGRRAEARASLSLPRRGRAPPARAGSSAKGWRRRAHASPCPPRASVSP